MANANTSSSSGSFWADLYVTQLMAANKNRSSNVGIQDQRTANQPLVTPAKEQETERKYPNAPLFVAGKGPPDYWMPIPSQFARDMLLNYRYVPLWYFTRDGCRNALDDSDLDQVVRDEDLTWEQVRSSKITILNCLCTPLESWPENRINQLYAFFTISSPMISIPWTRARKLSSSIKPKFEGSGTISLERHKRLTYRSSTAKGLVASGANWCLTLLTS